MKTLALFALIAAASCSSSGEPTFASVTLRISNATCSATGCRSLHVYATPDNQPNTPGGGWLIDLGTLSTPAACFTFPLFAKFTISGPDGTVEKEFKWTPADPASLVFQYATDPPHSFAMSTKSFVPGRAGGWTVTVPDGADLTQSENPCASAG